MSIAPHKELDIMIDRFEGIVEKEAQRLVDFAIKQNISLNVYILGEYFHMKDNQLVRN